MDKWLSRLDASGWLTHVKSVLCCACVVAQCVDKEGNASCLLCRYSARWCFMFSFLLVFSSRISFAFIPISPRIEYMYWSVSI